MLYYEIRKKDFSVKNNLHEIAFRDHIHKDLEIMYIKSGEQKISIDNFDYTLKKNDIAVIFPNELHSYYALNTPPSEIDEILIICSYNFYKNFFSDISNLSTDTPMLKLENLSDEAIYALERINSSMPQNMQIGMILIILSSIFSNIEIKRVQNKSSNDTVLAILTYVNENFTLPLTLESVAHEFHISKSYVSSIFSDRVKMNFKRYIGLLRAEYAATLIRTTNYNLTLISEDAGFGSIRNFNRVFKEIYGISPKSFRESINRYSSFK